VRGTLSLAIVCGIHGGLQQGILRERHHGRLQLFDRSAVDRHGLGHDRSRAGVGSGDGCFNYFFLPPIGRFTIADPQNWVALLAFLATALVASHLSDRAKKQALDARQPQRETEQLYALSRAILLSDAKPAVVSASGAIDRPDFRMRRGRAVRRSRRRVVSGRPGGT